MKGFSLLPCGRRCSRKCSFRPEIKGSTGTEAKGTKTTAKHAETEKNTLQTEKK